LPAYTRIRAMNTPDEHGEPAGDSGKTILIVDDETHIGTLLQMNLKTHGYRSLFAATGEEAVALARSEKPDLVLLDVMLPGMDGIQVCRILKDDPQTRRIPVLMLSAKSAGQDRISGLEGGADDYITKPFDMKELYLRIRAALRQVDLLTGSGDTFHTAGSLTLDSGKYQVTSNGERIDLTLTEFRILHFLMKNQGREVLRETINREVLDREPAETGRAVDVHVRNIRKKLAAGEVTGCAIETVHGTGYRLIVRS